MWYLFPSLMWHCWLGDRKDIRPVKSWVLVCWWWQFDWSFAHVAGAVVSTTPTPVNSNMETLWCRITQLVLEWPLNEWRCCWWCCYVPGYKYGMVYYGLTSHSTQYRSFRRRPGYKWRFQMRLFGALKQHCRQWCMSRCYVCGLVVSRSWWYFWICGWSSGLIKT